LMGGDQAFLKKLNTLFDQPSTLPADAPPDIAGMIGQYAHGNEPSHHIAYLFAFAGEPSKTQERIHQINTTLYRNNVDAALEGNEDCGQMSAWFVLSALGFYSVDPVSTQYIFGTPLFDRTTLRLAEGKQLILEAKRKTADSIYIDSVAFNDRPHTASWFNHDLIRQGGRFVFQLGSRPDSNFGRAPKDRPHSVATL
jgi:predicted alpha-1,2-mannosidase